MVVIFPDYTEALAGALAHHLRTHFVAPDVRIVEADARPDASSARIVATQARVRDDGIKRVELALEDELGDRASAIGERRPRRHLAWMIPVAMTVVGSSVLSMTKTSIYVSALKNATADAIDGAARAYASRIHDACAAPASPAYCRPAAAP